MSRKPPSSDVCVTSCHPGRVNEVLQPTLVSLSDGRCYRKMIHSFGQTEETHMDFSVTQTYMDDRFDEGGEDDETELEGVEPLPGGKGFMLRMVIPSDFYKYIIGWKGSTKSSIEKDTKTRIRVPQRGTEGDIVIEGETVSRLFDAKRRLDIIVWSNRLKEPISHFISIPLNHPIITERLNEFRSQVLASCSKDKGVSEDLFQTPAKLHLTVGVMRLFTPEEVEKAKSVLEECVIEARDCLGDETVMITLSGVDCMNDDPSAVSVLYAKVSLKDSSARLQRFVDTLVTSFMEKAPDLMTREFERIGVKLHATILNSAFRELADQQKALRTPHRGRGPRETFDARTIFKKFGEFKFGEIPLQHVHLSKRGEYGPDGFYRCVRHYPIDTVSCG